MRWPEHIPRIQAVLDRVADSGDDPHELLCAERTKADAQVLVAPSKVERAAWNRLAQDLDVACRASSFVT